MTARPGAISIIVPVLNDGAVLRSLLADLEPLRRAGHELIVVDGGSDDDSAEVARKAGATVLQGARGRGRQLNLGARRAVGEWLWFVHADTRVGGRTLAALQEAAGDATWEWGRFDLRLAERRWIYRVIERLSSWRSRLSGMATGDQAMVVRRTGFFAVGGFPEWPLMEDLALSRSLRRTMRPRCFTETVLTSGRRWKEQGVARTVLRMWALRLAFWLGVPPERLARYYPPCSSPTPES